MLLTFLFSQIHTRACLTRWFVFTRLLHTFCHVCMVHAACAHCCVGFICATGLLLLDRAPLELAYTKGLALISIYPNMALWKVWKRGFALGFSYVVFSRNRLSPRFIYKSQTAEPYKVMKKSYCKARQNKKQHPGK